MRDLGGIQSFFYGALLPWGALRLIVRHPVLMAWSLLPLTVAAALSVWGVREAKGVLTLGIQQALLALGWDPSGTVASVLLVILAIGVFLAGAFVFAWLAAVLALPFNDALAESAETRATPPLSPVPNRGWRHTLRLLRVDLGKSLFSAVGLALALLGTSIPGVNLVCLPAAFLLMTFQFVSYPQTRRGMSIGDGLAFLWRYRFASLGFGLVTTGLFAIPLFAGFALPISVVGGTLLHARASAPARLR